MNICNNLIMLHGWGFNKSIWDYNKEHLSLIKDKNFNIIKVDLNGHGDSAYRSYQDINNYIDYLANNFIDNYTNFENSNNYLLGWSLGGIIALNLKYKYPELFKNIILCCSNPCFIANNHWEYGVSEQYWNKFNSQLKLNPSKTIKDFLLLQVFNTRNYKVIYKRLLDIYNYESSNIDGLDWGLDILKNNYFDLLDKINNKNIKLILGKRDSLVNNKISDYLKINYPGVEVNILDNSGHMPFITEPKRFYNLVQEYITTDGYNK